MDATLRPQALPTLRFLTCGSVDDGKSTLIGRLLYEQKLIFDDQLSALERDSKKHGTTGDDIDFALLVDGLEAEREQGITIDVAYRYFATEKRSFIVADTPGHEQYTRNMATGASNADLAILLDRRAQGPADADAPAFADRLAARHPPCRAGGQQDRPRRFRARRVFDEIVAAFAEFAEPLAFRSVRRDPDVGALRRQRLVARASARPGMTGPTLLAHLESVDVEDDRATAPFRLPVQWVNRPNLDFRGYAGTIASGRCGAATRSSSPPPAARPRWRASIVADELRRGGGRGRRRDA